MMTNARLRAVAERALGRPVAHLVADTLGGSNAVSFLDLHDGDRCVLRVSPPGQGPLVAQEVWALDTARRSACRRRRCWSPTRPCATSTARI